MYIYIFIKKIFIHEIEAIIYIYLNNFLDICCCFWCKLNRQVFIYMGTFFKQIVCYKNEN